MMCLFCANFVHISAVPIPQNMYPIVCCCGPCDGGSSVAYSVPDPYISDAVPVGYFPIPIGFDPNSAQVAAPIDTTYQIPSSDPNSPAPDGTGTAVSNGSDDPIGNLARSTFSQLVQFSYNPTDLVNNVNSFFSRMIDSKTM